MKHLTKDLTGALLDAAVAKADGRFTVANNGENLRCYARDGDQDYSAGELVFFMPSTNWADGGPIIERERISVLECGSGWFAHVAMPVDPEWRDDPHDEYWEIQIPRESVSPTPLVAAMRAYVASKLGAEIELP